MNEIYELFQIFLAVFAFIGLFSVPVTAYLSIQQIIQKKPYSGYIVMFIVSIISVPTVYILYRLLMQVRGY